MLYYDRIDLFEGNNVNKTSMVFVTIGIFLDESFKFQPDFCNECHDVLKMFTNLNEIAILNIRGVDYRCTINGISKSVAVNSLQNANLTEGKRVL